MQQTLIKPIGKGQITIPGNWRKNLGITKNTYIKATLVEGGVLIQNSGINFDDISSENDFDESIKKSFEKITSSGKLDNLSKLLSEKY